jgi:hypothetical protein
MFCCQRDQTHHQVFVRTVGICSLSSVFSSEILVDGENAGAVDAAEGAGDPGAVTSSASSLYKSNSICVRTIIPSVYLRDLSCFGQSLISLGV